MTEQIELRPPEQVFNGENLPDDLKWLMTAFNLPKSDPAVVLIAWHWKRVANTQDIIKVGQMELIAALESRIDNVRSFAETIQQVDANLGLVSTALTREHLHLKTKIETELKHPLAEILANASRLSTTLETLLKTIQTSAEDYNKKRWNAAYWGGCATGVLITACVCWLLFAR